MTKNAENQKKSYDDSVAKDLMELKVKTSLISSKVDEIELDISKIKDNDVESDKRLRNLETWKYLFTVITSNYKAIFLFVAFLTTVFELKGFKIK